MAHNGLQAGIVVSAFDLQSVRPICESVM